MTIETNVLVREATTAADDELTVNLNIEYLTWFFLRFSERARYISPTGGGK